MEIKFLKLLFFLMDKSNYKMVTNREFEVANEGSYKLTLPVEVDTSKVRSLQEIAGSVVSSKDLFKPFKKITR